MKARLRGSLVEFLFLVTPPWPAPRDAWALGIRDYPPGTWGYLAECWRRLRRGPSAE